MIESALYTALCAASAVAPLVTTPASGPTPAVTRIYPLLVPTDSALPAIDYAFIAGSSEGTFNSRGSSRWRVEINCWGATYSDAITLRAAVIDALDGHRDANFTSRLIMPRDFFDDELLQYRAMAEFYVMFNF